MQASQKVWVQIKNKFEAAVSDLIPGSHNILLNFKVLWRTAKVLEKRADCLISWAESEVCVTRLATRGSEMCENGSHRSLISEHSPPVHACPHSQTCCSCLHPSHFLTRLKIVCCATYNLKTQCTRKIVAEISRFCKESDPLSTAFFCILLKYYLSLLCSFP